MTDLNTDHLSQRERYLMTMVYSAFLGYTKNQEDAARDVNYIVRSADKLEPIEPTTPQPSADAVRELLKRWRGSGKDWYSNDFDIRGSERRKCADELESLLSGGSHA